MDPMERQTLPPCWSGSRLVRLLWESVRSVLKIPCESARQPLSTYARTPYPSTEMPVQLQSSFIEVMMSMTVKKWGSPEVLPQINGVWRIYKMEFHSAARKSYTMKISRTWMGSDNLLLSRATQIQTDKNCVVPPVSVFENVTMVRKTLHDDFEKYYKCLRD